MPASSSEIGPWRTTAPRSTMATASQVRSTSSRRCEDNTTVRPSATSERIISRMSCMPAGSSPFMGSSRISSWGSPIRQAATPRRWRIPIEYFDTLSSARPKMPTRSRAGPIRWRAGVLAGRGEDLEVLAARQMAVEPGLVDDGPHPGQGLVAVAGHGVSQQRHRAGIGVGQSQQDPDERGLARPVRAQVAEGTAPGDEELHAVHGDVLPEALGQTVGLDGPPALGRLLLGGGREVQRFDHGPTLKTPNPCEKVASRNRLSGGQPPCADGETTERGALRHGEQGRAGRRAYGHRAHRDAGSHDEQPVYGARRVTR